MPRTSEHDTASFIPPSDTPADHTLAELSEDILVLERIHRRGGMSSQQSDRWMTLMKRWVLGNRTACDKRRFLRLPCKTEVRIVLGDATRTFETIEISHGGLSLAGDVGRKLEAGTKVQWKAAHSPSGWVRLGAACQVVHTPDPSILGLRFTGGAGPAYRRIFDHLYYPAYLHALEALARGDMASL